MHKPTIRIVLSCLMFFGIVDGARAQIVASLPPLPVSCRDEQLDTQAACARTYFCTKPPNLIDAFGIAAFAFRTCPGTPVINVARVDAKIGGMQASADGMATSLFFGRRIKEQLTLGDCNGVALLVVDFEDPQGCNPPPPPPPPTGGSGGGEDPPCDLGFAGSNQGPCSPIIIDIEGEDFHLTSAAGGVMFDIAGNGHPVRIAWTAAGFHNAFLALPGADGLVHNGKELFGNFTAQDPSTRRNGFLALAEFDEPDQGGNGDGIIDEYDSVYSRLRLWIDENHDGISQPSELHTLAELGVYSLSLDYRHSRRTDEFGNQFRLKAQVNPGIRRDRRDEASEIGRWTYDVFLTTAQK